MRILHYCCLSNWEYYNTAISVNEYYILFVVNQTFSTLACTCCVVLRFSLCDLWQGTGAHMEISASSDSSPHQAWCTWVFVCLAILCLTQKKQLLISDLSVFLFHPWVSIFCVQFCRFWIVPCIFPYRTCPCLQVMLMSCRDFRFTNGSRLKGSFENTNALPSQRIRTNPVISYAMGRKTRR